MADGLAIARFTEYALAIDDQFRKFICALAPPLPVFSVDSCNVFCAKRALKKMWKEIRLIFPERTENNWNKW